MSFCVIGSRGAGKRSFLGCLLLEDGSCHEKQVERAKRLAPPGDEFGWARRLWSTHARHIPWYKQVLGCTFMNAPVNLKAAHRVIFTCSECVLVLSAKFNNWDDVVGHLVIAKVLKRRVAAIVVTMTDLVVGPHDSVVDEAVRLMGKLGMANGVWSPALHSSMSLVFRQRVFTLLLCIRRLPHFVPRDVVYLIIRELAKVDGMAVPVLMHSIADPASSTVVLDALKELLAKQPTPLFVAGGSLFVGFDLYKILGIGTVGVGRMVNGSFSNVQEIFLRGGRRSDNINRCNATFERHHVGLSKTSPGEFVGANIWNCPMRCIPGRHGYVAVSMDSCVSEVLRFEAQLFPVKCIKQGRIYHIFAHCSTFTARMTHLDEATHIATFEALDKMRCVVSPIHQDLAIIMSYENKALCFSGLVQKILE